MNTKPTVWTGIILLTLMALLISGCGGGGNDVTTGGSTPQTGSDNNGAEATVEVSDRDKFPEVLVVHPEAYNFKVTEATHTYVYHVPFMVQETVTYLETELRALGWDELGQPVVMGHLATLNMQQENYKLTISMQDNEQSISTRVQMILLER